MAPRPFGRRGLLLAAAGTALAGVWRWRDRPAVAQSMPSYDVLNLALTSEYSMLAAYGKVLEGGVLEDWDLAAAEALLADTRRSVEHLRQAISALGAQPVDEDPYTFPPEELADRARALQLLLRLENLGTSGWIGSQDLTADPATLALGTVLFARRARRAAAVGMLLGDQAAPFAGAFEAGMSLPRVLSAVEQYRGGAR